MAQVFGMDVTSMHALRTPPNPIRRSWLLLILGLSLGIQVTQAQVTQSQVEVKLRGEVLVTEQVFLQLGDFAVVTANDSRLTEQLSELTLFPAPVQTCVLAQSRIAERLGLLGVDLFSVRWSGADEVRLVVNRTKAIEAAEAELRRVETSAVTQASLDLAAQTHREIPAWQRDSLNHWCEDAVQEALQDWGLSCVEIRCDATLLEPWQAGGVIEKVTFESTVSAGPNTAQLAIATDRGTVVRQVVVEARTAPRLVYTRRQLRRGQIVQIEDLELKAAASSEGASAGFTDIQSVVGQELAVNLEAGQVILPNQIQTPVLVQRNKTVWVYSVAGELRVRTAGRALDQGGLNDLVAVEVGKDRRRLTGRVIGENEVEIQASVPRVR